MFPGISRLPDFTRMKQDMRGGAGGEGDRHLLGCNFFFPSTECFSRHCVLYYRTQKNGNSEEDRLSYSTSIDVKNFGVLIYAYFQTGF